jgi:glucose/mannose-6-phosphate isomerase
MIICCGMGGSSVAGELLSLVRPDVVVHWDWGILASATPSDHVVCTSWSGNTAETISSYDAARAAGIPVSVITTGGVLAEKAKADGVALILLPSTGTPPRQNALAMTEALFKLLGVAESLPAIDRATADAEGAQLAASIGAKIPIFYAAYPWRKVAGFFKTVINEDAKRHSWAANIPSAEHNELAGWAGNYQDSMLPVLIRTDDERPQDTKDLDALVALFEKMRYTVATVRLAGATPLEKALDGYAVALRAGQHVAAAAHVDAADTTLIEAFKQLKTT